MITFEQFDDWLATSKFAYDEVTEGVKSGISIFVPNEWENPEEKILTEKFLYNFLKTSPVEYTIKHADGEYWPSRDFSCDVGVSEINFNEPWELAA